MKFFHLNNPAFYKTFIVLESEVQDSCLRILAQTTNKNGSYVDVFRIYGDWLSENQDWKIFAYGRYITIETYEDWSKVKSG